MSRSNRRANASSLEQPLKIGALARETGTNIETVRYYERIGLLSRAPRTEGGFRLYGPSDIRRLRFVRRARDLGFSIDAVRELIGFSDDPFRPCDEVDAIARTHLDDVTEKISHLNALRAELARLIRSCQGGHISDCRIVDALSGGRISNRLG